VKPSRHISAFDLSLLADNWNTADGLLTKPSDLEDREHTLIFIKRAMDSCHSLKLLNLAARFHIHTCGVFYIQLALKAGTLIQNIKVWLISILPNCPGAFSACFLSFCAKYDKQLIFHG
jgi:hypothetical protein